MASSNQGVDIDPTTLKDGSLLATFDPVANPGTSGYGATVNTGTPKTGALGVPVLSAPVAATGGSLTAGTYDYEVSAVGAFGEGRRCPAQSAVAPASGQVTLTWTAPAGETGGFKVYQNDLHLADVAHGTLTYVDNGTVVPSGAESTNSVGDAGMLQGDASPRPSDAGHQGHEGEGDGLTPTEAGTGLTGR